MIDLKDYSPEEIQFKLPTTVKFPEVIFPDCVSIDDIKKKLAENFITIQEKDVIANRVMDDYEISTIRANYGEIAEEQMPEDTEDMDVSGSDEDMEDPDETEDK